ncbi:hypothetical protein A1359_21595 [Methylomonas lenta]|uniref:Uncharacterized protein n=2 Tax=Methylomonas lenta TaxID=980561 RepID=A0A177NNS2_9GAMM|nr:hypothetical protein A1359_21595 [Methylomonas lenta]
MEATKVMKPWMTHLEVHQDEYLCVVCQNCDNQLMEAEWQVVDDDETGLLELISLRSKEIA